MVFKRQPTEEEMLLQDERLLLEDIIEAKKLLQSLEDDLLEVRKNLKEKNFSRVPVDDF